MDCLDDDTVLAFAQGRLPRDRAALVHEHLRGCADCHLLVAEAAKFVHTADQASGEASTGEPPTAPGRPAPAPPEADGMPLPAGTAVSRYLIETPLGTGATGVVYRAWDPQLRRRVALKLLRPGHEPERLLREAQAMAQLSHPNVVNVFDAGTYRGQVFIVMELVDGETLAQWLRQDGRPWRDVVAAFAEAGRGLAAAHAAALVHRDFKPDNVLVASDGRVRVTDFGLARSLGAAPLEAGPARGASASAGATVVPGGGTLTAPAGTPIYMAPEQLRGTRADARSDQFSFCVALFLALYGRHPFGGAARNLLDLARGLEAAEVGARAAGEQLPPALREVLARGLGVEPERRHPSMEALVTALESILRPPAPLALRQRRTAAALGGGGAALIAIALLAWRAAAPAAACGNGRVEPGEECDDGNRADGDGCLTSCRHARCGDGKLRAGVEECDDGNTASGDGCSARCLACREGDAALAWDETGHCYSRHDRPLPWAGARAACAALGGELVTYTSSYESRAVWNGLFAGGARPRPPSWIGLAIDVTRPGETDLPPRERPGDFAWVTREAIPKLWWAEGQPQAGAGACAFEQPDDQLKEPAALLAGSAFATADCARPLPFVCERGGWAIRPSNNHAYRVFVKAVPWPAAAATCRAAGGHLVTITDVGEHDFVAAQAAFGFWIDGTEGPEPRALRWTTGEPFSFHRFAPGEPDGPLAIRDCGFFGADRLWHDRACVTGHPFMCEMD